MYTPGLRGRLAVIFNLAAWGWPASFDSAIRSSRPSTPIPEARSIRKCSRSVVAHASSSARWLGWCARRSREASVPSLQFGTSSRTKRRANATVSMIVPSNRGRPLRSSAARIKATSNPTLCPTITVPPASVLPMNSSRAGSTVSIRGAVATSALLRPVKTVIFGGIARPGLTSVWNVPSTSPPLTLTAPISVIKSSCRLPPVVSRSTMQNVTSLSGRPSSSNDRCTNGTTLPIDIKELNHEYWCKVKQLFDCCQDRRRTECDSVRSWTSSRAPASNTGTFAVLSNSPS